MNYKVRKLKNNDLSKLLELYSFLNPDDVKPSKSALLKAWDNIINNTDKFFYLVIEDKRKIISTCNITIIPKLTRGASPFGIIENVVTHPDYRRLGLGKKVINEALKIAKKEKCRKVMLLSNNKRKESHKFYEALGFDSTEKKGFVYNL